MNWVFFFFIRLYIGKKSIIFYMGTIIEIHKEYNFDVCSCFTDYSNVLDCVQQETLLETIFRLGFPVQVKMIRSLYHEPSTAV